ncbi:MAG: hypothetical protein R3B09_24455 [Nannocystaceae bacterium]
MLGFLRTAISVLFVTLVVWCSFTVPLGRRTFADHVDRIGQTREAEELITGARARVRPLLDEVKNRFLGEYVEAPTYLPSAPGDAPRRAPTAAKARGDDPAVKSAAAPKARAADPTTKAGAATPPAADAKAAKAAKAAKDPAPAASGEGGSIYASGSGRAGEPALPGRRRRGE